MSVIFGIFYKDGTGVAREPESMYEGMKRFPHETHAFAVRGNCGFGHMLTYNTPEAARESMPKWVEDARILFVAEGRLDNRAELLDALGIPEAERAGTADGDLLLGAYLRWGEQCVNRCMGKWSLAAFHAEENRLFLARDAWDYTNVAYYADSRVFAFSSSEKGLYPLPFVPKEIDERMIARMLIAWPGDHNRSFFQGIDYLLPSHAMRITRESERVRRYWNYADIGVRRGLKLEEYTGALLDNLRKAVAARLRSYKPVAATLSGGLDSSTVCMLAAGQLAARGLRLKTYSHTPLFAPSAMLDGSRFGDERPYIETVVAAAGSIDAEYLQSSDVPPLTGIREAVGILNGPVHGSANAYWVMDIYKAAVRDGYGTLLSGEFGNATISWSGVEDALPAGEILRRYGMAATLKKKLLKPVLYGGTPVGALYRRLAFGRQPWDRYSYCGRAFEETLRLRGQVKESGFNATLRMTYPNPKDMALLILDTNVQRLYLGAEIGHALGIEFRDPTSDPRVIESALAIPNEMFFGDMNRWVLRTMMRGILPDAVRLNDKRGKQSSDIAFRLCAHSGEAERLFAEMEEAGIGRVLNLEKLRASWNKLRANPAGFPLIESSCMLRAMSVFDFYQYASGLKRSPAET